jgi:hypothetical protein
LPAEFEGALQRLAPAALPATPGLATSAAPQAAASLDPRRFLLGVMNDDRLDLSLRIEAAKALLPSFDAAPGLSRQVDGSPRS